MSVLHAVEIVAVKIPAAEIQRDNSATGLHQSPRHQEVFQVSRSTIAETIGVAFTITLANSFRFFGNVQGIDQSTAGQNVEGLPGQRVETFQSPATVHVASQPINAAE